MKKPLLLLNALRAFEATARFLSIAKAADELSVTQGAVSHHIKKLERTLGVTLFVRQGGTLELTESGSELSGGVQQSFRALEAAVSRSIAASRTNVITVNSMPCFAEMWLVPRIPRFLELFPDTPIRVRTVTQNKNALAEDADITIRYRPGPFPGFKVDRLQTEDVFPVCSPELLPTLKTPGDLASCRLIHDDWLRVLETFPTWGDWLVAADIDGVDTSRGLRLNSTSAVIAMTVRGQGVSLGRSLLVADLLRDGKLVRPFDFQYPLSFAYYVVLPRNTAVYKKVSQFRDWLMSEASL